MEKIISAPPSTSPSIRGGNESKRSQKTTIDGSHEKQQFVALALHMSWQLAVVVLIPIVIGVQLDKHTAGNSFTWTFIGLAIALVGSGFVMWRMLQQANTLPVQKLTDAQKREIKKSYEEDDADV